jgi:nicotinamide-nucleotide amidase
MTDIDVGRPDGQDAETLSPILPDDIEKAAADVLAEACRLGLKLTTAESCTGGLLASLLTDIEGASHAFDRGFIVYSDEAKCELLGVRHHQIDECGAVSQDVAIAMAEGALSHSLADIAIAITGYASAAPEGEEAGLVHFATACRGGQSVHAERHLGDIGRGAARISSLRTALEMMRRAVARNCVPLLAEGDWPAASAETGGNHVP